MNAISPERRMDLLSKIPAFAVLSASLTEELARRMVEEAYRPGDPLVREGEEGDRLFLIAEGRAEVTTTANSKKVVLGILGKGEMFGEIALILPSHERQATVTALTLMHTLTLDVGLFRALIFSHSEFREAIGEMAELMLTVRFMKQASPFSTVDIDVLYQMARRVRKVSFPAGAVIIRQGEAGETCYLIRKGKAEVLQKEEPGERVIATLSSGSLFGEMALITDGTRNATVRATEACELLELRREDLLGMIQTDRKALECIIDLVGMRDRPCAVKGISAHEMTTDDGEKLIILRDPERDAYFKLSPDGWFIWPRLDGRHTVRDLMLDYLITFRRFSPLAVIELIARLRAAGFIENPLERLADLAGRSSVGRVMLLIKRALTWRIALRNVDAAISRLYKGGIRHLFALPAQVIMGLLAVSGLACFILAAGGSTWSSVRLSIGGVALFYAVILPLSIVIHEAGHAFTAKALGQKIHSIGIKWQLFYLVFDVDTRDMWLAGKKQRIAVSLAGPYANAVTAGLASLLTLLPFASGIRTALFLFAALSYALGFLSLCPIANSDGYHMLADSLEQPNLSSRALAWISGNFLSNRSAALRALESRSAILFIAVVILYIALVAAFAIFLFMPIGGEP